MTSGKLVQDDAPLNLRASCIAGHPIYGTALLSKIRLRPHEWNQPSVRWGSYTLALYEARIKSAASASVGTASLTCIDTTAASLVSGVLAAGT